MHLMRLALIVLGFCSLVPDVVPVPGPVAISSVDSQGGSQDVGDDGSRLLERFQRPPVVSSARSVSRSANAATALTIEEQELVNWAFARFAQVGMELPPVAISFHDDTDACGGARGRFRGSGDDRTVIVCVLDAGTFATRLERQRTLVHELAHAWDHANLDDDTRRHLLPIVDAHDWFASDADWDARGIERFAETIVWGLYDQLRRPVLIDASCGELHADFLVITGTSPPGPLERVCHLPPSRFHNLK